jgi:DNA polymerase-3 subunit alpha
MTQTMVELINWLNSHKISFNAIDREVVEIESFGKMFLCDLSGVQSVFRMSKGEPEFNLMENPDILKGEGIYYVAFPFGENWYYYDLREAFRFNILKYTGKRQPAKRNIPFVNLGVHTPYELLNASGAIKDWVKKACWMGHEAIGIADYHTMAATLHLQKECDKAGLKPVFGYSFTLEVNGKRVDMKIYCQSQAGLKNLLRIQKEIMVDSPDNTLSLNGLLKYAGGNVLVFGSLSSYWMAASPLLISSMEKAFDRVFYQVDLTEYKADRIDVETLKAISHFFDSFYLPETDAFRIEPILICDNYYLDRDDAASKVIVNKVATGASHRQSDEQYFKDIDELMAVFQSLFDANKWDVDALFRRMCAHSVEIAENATARFKLGEMYMPFYRMLADEINQYGGRRSMFRSLVEEGLREKTDPEQRRQYRERLEEEAYIIESTNNVDYFLIQWDMVNEARKRGIATGIGRGSAGGSLVSYLLGITSIDPVKYNLIFSRFLVPERCGLNWVDEITVIGEDREIEEGSCYVEIELDEGRFNCYQWAKLRIRRGNTIQTVYANDLREEDDILFDNRDRLWTIKDLIISGESFRQ